MNINQGQDINLRKLRRSLSKVSNTLKLDINSINNDIEKIKIIRDKVLDTDDIKQLIPYIDNTKKDIEAIKGLIATNNEILLNWVIEGNELKSTPINFSSIKLGKAEINTTDYIVLDNTKLISIDLRKLLSIIAFEVTHRDIGIENKEIEEYLSKNCNLIGINEGDVFKEFITDRFYEKALVLKLEDTMYKNINNNKLYTYYGDCIGKSKYYRDILIPTYKKTLYIVLEYIMDIINGANLDIQFIGITYNKLYFLDSSTNGTASKGLGDKIDLSVRVFGRNFKVDTDIETY